VSTGDLQTYHSQNYHQTSESVESSASDIQNDSEVSPVPSNTSSSSTLTTTTTSASENQSMIIKARPLTIRKQPLSEQPKLRSQSSTAKNNTVNLATTRRIEMPPAYLFAEMDKMTSEQNQQDINNQNNRTNEKFNGNKITNSNINNTSPNADVPDRAIISPEVSETSSEDQSEKNGVTNITDQMNAVDLNNGEIVSRRIKKGNLKQSGKMNLSRRVSFDPLALLLDASLEGELELVKKTATQVYILIMINFMFV
jgi:apoptosis-stimulating of p53 protein 1